MRKQNTSYLLKLWIPAVIVLIIVVVEFSGMIYLRSYLPIIFIIGFTGVIVGWIIYSTFSKISRLLQAPSPQPLIDFYNKRLGKRALIPARDVSLAFSVALAYTIYGYFELAKTEIDKINWEQKPPLLRAQRTFMQALWAYLERHDFQQGIRLAQEARQLAEVSSSFPGASTSLGSFDMAIEIGEVLSGNPKPSTVTSLEARIKRFPVLMKILAAWGLEGYYLQSNQIEQAQIMRELLNKIAPHCTGLNGI